MQDITIVYWRDIPAQVIVGSGRRAAKIQLSERFEQAIDRCAMKIGARDSDAYLAQWHKKHIDRVEGDADDVAKSTAEALEADYDQARIRTLIANDGWT